MRKGTDVPAACNQLPSPDMFWCSSMPVGSQCGHTFVSENNIIISQVQKKLTWHLEENLKQLLNLEGNVL